MHEPDAPVVDPFATVQPLSTAEPIATRALRKIADGAEPAANADGESARNISADAIRTGSAAGTKLLSYRLGELVGAGGMGTVYKATHIWLGQTLALKFIAPQVANVPEAVTRFEYEAQAIGALDHPHIVRATDAGQYAGLYYLATEFVEGGDMARLVARRGSLSAADACQVVLQAALGLQHAFEHGLVHRDVKPSNLLINAQGVVKLVDFGIARLVADCATLTSTGQLLGTLDYMAPEQATNAHQVDIRADIYSLGCTLYYLLSGEPPFSGPKYQTPAAKIKGHLADIPASLVSSRGPLPRPVVACIERMMAKSPDDRFSSPAEIAEALAPYARTARLQALVSGDLCRDSAAHAKVSQEPADDSWPSAIRRLVGSVPLAAACVGQSMLPVRTASAAQQRRRPLVHAGAFAVFSLLGSLLVFNFDVPSTAVAVGPAAAPPPAVDRRVFIEDLDWPGNRQPSVEVRSPAPIVPAAPQEKTPPPAVVATPVLANVAPPALPTVAKAPAASVPNKPASSTTARSPAARPTASKTPAGSAGKQSSPVANSPAAADGPEDNRWPATRSSSSGGRSSYSSSRSGSGYQVSRQYGSPPPGFDPRKPPRSFDPRKPPPGFDPRQGPPGMDGMMPPPPPWVLEKLGSGPSGRPQVPGSRFN